MEPSPPQSLVRPTSVVIIAWFWVLFAVATACSFLKSVLTARKLHSLDAGVDGNAEAERLIRQVDALVGGGLVEAVLTGIVFLAAIMGAIGLLKLKNWGRNLIVVLSWLGLLATLLGIPYLIWIVTIARPLEDDLVNGFLIFFWIVAGMQALAGVLLFGWMLRCLNSERLRDAI